LLKLGPSSVDQPIVERRWNDGSEMPIVAPCRRCSQPQLLSPARAEVRDGQAYHRCRACNVWFVIRWDDAVALGVVPAQADAPPVAAS
jgi:hypothetical protein